MFFLYSPCFPAFFYVFPWFSLFSRVFLCFPLILLVFPCFSMFSLILSVFPCFSVFSSDSPCFPAFFYVFPCFPMFFYVFPWFSPLKWETSVSFPPALSEVFCTSIQILSTFSFASLNATFFAYFKNVIKISKGFKKWNCRNCFRKTGLNTSFPSY